MSMWFWFKLVIFKALICGIDALGCVILLVLLIVVLLSTTKIVQMCFLKLYGLLNHINSELTVWTYMLTTAGKNTKQNFTLFWNWENVESLEWFQLCSQSSQCTATDRELYSKRRAFYETQRCFRKIAACCDHRDWKKVIEVSLCWCFIIRYRTLSKTAWTICICLNQCCFNNTVWGVSYTVLN